jgi:hypothetical protein
LALARPPASLAISGKSAVRVSQKDIFFLTAKVQQKVNRCAIARGKKTPLRARWERSRKLDFFLAGPGALLRNIHHAAHAHAETLPPVIYVKII